MSHENAVEAGTWVAAEIARLRTLSHYQPESHYWPLQLAETGLFVGTAIALILFAAWWTHQRTA